MPVVKKLIPKRLTLIKRVWKTSSGTAWSYRARIYVPKVDKYLELALTSRDENEAITEAIEVYSGHSKDINEGRDPSQRRTGLADHINAFNEYQESRVFTNSITERRFIVLKHNLKSLLEFAKINKNPPLDDLAKIHDSKFIAWRSKAKTRLTKTKLTNRTLNTEIQAHRQFFNWALDENLSTRTLKGKSLPTKRSNKPFPKEFYRKFLAVGKREIEESKNPRTKFELMNYRTIVMVMNGLGCRVTEIKNLKWSDIKMVKNGIQIYLHGKNKERTIQIPERVYGHLKNLRKVKTSMGASFGWNEDDYPYVFSSYKSKTVSQSFSSSTRRRWAKKIGLEGDYDLVCFRHKFITDALNNGVHSLSVAKYTGTSQAMIERTYSGLVTGDVYNLVFEKAPKESLAQNKPVWIDKLVQE